MTDRTKKFENELIALIKNGEMLLMAIQWDCHPEAFTAAYKSKFGVDDKKNLDAYVKELPDFHQDYQKWYSKAQAVVKQVLPDRFSDFVSHYEYPRVRKRITSRNYMVRDYLQGLRITQDGGTTVIADGSSALPEFRQQLNIVRAAKDCLESKLMDLSAILQADLFDTEVESAAALAKAGFLGPLVQFAVW